MASPTANKQRGARYEIDLVKGLRAEGFDAERLRLNGKDDEGDIVIREDGFYTIIEAKSGAIHAAEFVRQAETEAGCFLKNRGLTSEDGEGIVVIKARGKSWADSYVLTTLRQYLALGEE